jgi:2-alkyl-3-oxoalkanoate reductase
MRILVAGATGAVGRNLLARLVAAGHQVVGTTRTEAKTRVIRELGGEALVADGLDAGAIQRAVESARPDAIVHEMTDLKGASDFCGTSTALLRSATSCAPRGRIT